MDRNEYLNGSQLLYQLLDNDVDGVKIFMESSMNADVELEYQFKFIHPLNSYEKIFNSKTTPLEIAIPRLYYELVELLVSFGANIEDKLFDAIRTDDEKMIQLVVRLGAKLDVIDNVGKNAYTVACYHNCYRAMDVLNNLGLNVEKYGGDSLRRSADNGDFKAVKFFLDNGVNINYREPDMVYSYASTPVIEAARNNNYEMVKLLVERGADITISDNYGDRPYTCAIKNKNFEMAEYLKSLEPSSWHNEQERIKYLSKYKLPDELIIFLKEEELRINFVNNKYINYLSFYSLVDTVELEWNGKKLLSLVQEIDNYSFLIVWSQNDEKVCYLDTEHGRFLVFSTWTDFIKNIETYINGTWNGIFD